MKSCTSNLLLLIAECPVSYLRQKAPSYLSFGFLILSWLLLRHKCIREREKHGILCRGSRMLERRRKSMSVMRFERLAARLDGSRSGARR